MAQTAQGPHMTPPAEAPPAPPCVPEAPPGLQGGAAAGEGGRWAELAEALRQDVDAKVAEKMEEMARKGRAMLLQVQQREEEKADNLAAEVAACMASQSVLEAENAHLKQVIAGLASRLSMLGAAFGPGVSGPWHGLAASPASTAAATLTPSPAHQSASDFATPMEAAALPEVPAFPFAAARPGAAQLSLAEALCPQHADEAPPGLAPPHTGPTQLSLASSLTSGPAREPAAAATAGQPHEFSFTLRKADGTDLGLAVSQECEALLIESVRSGGAVEAWNRSCSGGPCPDRVVGHGDRIVGVNGVTQNPERMLEECEAKQLLRLTIRRGLASVAVSPEGSGHTSMRADASEFVPTGAHTMPAPDATAGA